MYTSGRALLRPRFADRHLLVRRNKSVRPTGVARESSVPTVPTVAVTSRTSTLGQRVWQSYTRSLHERPLVTKATFAATIFFFSDSCTQYIVCDDKQLFQWNAPRALSGASFGIIATGWLHYWWGFLEATVGRRLPVATHRLSNAAAKVLLDQAIGAPLYIYTYYVLTNFLQERMNHHSSNNNNSKTWQESWRETSARAQQMLAPTMLQHWRVWIPVHSVNFYFIPLHHRVMVQNTVLTFWSGYLSHLNHQTVMQTPDEEIKATIVRHETLQKRAQQQQQPIVEEQVSKQASVVLAAAAERA